MPMSFVTVVWAMPAAASLTLAAMHFLIWLKDPRAGAHLAFAVAAFAVTGIAAGEIQMMAADNPADFARLLRWTYVPVVVLSVAIVCFIGLYFRSGRAWLGWAAVGLRMFSLAVNFSVSENLFYTEIRTLGRMEFLGQTVSVVPAGGAANPWGVLGPLSSLLMMLFVVDASIRLWRTGGRDDRRKALIVGGGIAFCVFLGMTQSILIHAKFIESPYLVSVFFLGLIAVMAHELSRDVIAAVRLTRELHESEQQMTLAAAAAKLVLWTWDVAGNRVWVTNEGRRSSGISPNKEITVEHFLSSVHPDDREIVRQTMDRSLTGDGDFRADYRNRLADGSQRWIEARGRVEFGDGGKAMLLRGVSIDITERRDAEEKARLAVESAPSAMIMTDSSGRILLINRQTESTFGYSREELLGQPVELLIPDRFKVSHRAMREGFVADPTARAMGAGRELFGRRKDGKEVPLEVDLNSILTSEGRFVLASIVDITELRLAERERMEERDELFHLSRVTSLGQLSGSLAHELNQPLGIILSNAQAAQRMLAQQSPDLAELRDILDDIIGEDRRAGEVITRLRALLKRGETRLLPLALNEVIEDVLRLLRSDLVARGVTVQTALADRLANILGDRVQLQQVLLNIIINACDAMAENTPQERIIRISTSLRDGKVCVSVTDRGCGLPDGDASRIFQPFVTSKSHGLGIGLSICRSIIAGHQGHIRAESNAGRGTTFHIEFHPNGATLT